MKISPTETIAMSEVEALECVGIKIKDPSGEFATRGLVLFVANNQFFVVDLWFASNTISFLKSNSVSVPLELRPVLRVSGGFLSFDTGVMAICSAGYVGMASNWKNFSFLLTETPLQKGDIVDDIGLSFHDFAMGRDMSENSPLATVLVRRAVTNNGQARNELFAVSWR